MVLIFVAIVTAAAQGGITPVINPNIPVDNISQIQTFDKTLFVKCDDGSAYIVYLDTSGDEPENNSSAYDMCVLSGGNISIAPQNGHTIIQYSIFNFLPEPSTIAALGLAGLFLNRRKLTPAFNNTGLRYKGRFG